MAAPNADRDARIIAAVRLGQSHQAVAAEHGISRARVSQIAAKADPASPDEVQRQLVAERLRSRWDVLNAIVLQPPPQHSAIGRLVVTEDGTPIINASAVIQAVKAQLAIEAQYRQMFGLDISTRPGPLLDERERVMEAEIRAVQQYRATLAALPARPPLPPNYASMTPAEKADADLAARRIQLQAQQVAIDATRDDDVIDAEIVD
jgi:hypothetical protein